MKRSDSMFLCMQSISDEKYLWMLSYEINTLFQIQREDFSVKKYYTLPSQVEEMYTCMAYSACGIYMTPYIGTRMFYLDFANEKLNPITLSYDNSMVKVAFVSSYKEEVVVVSRDMQGIYYWNEKTQDLYKDESYLDALHEQGIDVKSALFSDIYCQIGKDIYILIIGTDALLKIDIEKKEYKVYRIFNDNNAFYTMDYFKDNTFIFTDEEGNTILWSPDTGIESVLKNEYKLRLLKDKGMFLKTLCIDNKIFYFGTGENRIFVRKDNNVYEIGKNIADDLYNWYGESKWVQFYFIVQCGEKIYFQTKRGGTIYCLDAESEEIVAVNELLTIEEKKRIASEAYKQNIGKRIIQESEVMGLAEFLNIC